LDKIGPRRLSLLANKASQESSRRLAAQNLERCRIVSPVAGVLQEVDVEIGENVMVGQRIARVVNLERLEVPLLLPASSRSFLAIGDTVQLFASGSGSHAWDAQVSRIAPEDDSSTRTVRVFAELQQNPAVGNVLSPGQFIQGKVASRITMTRWVVPRRSLNSDRVKVVENGQISSVPVTVEFALERPFPQFGLPDEQWVVLSEPLPVGTQVVVDGSRSLAVGSAALAVAATGADEHMPSREASPQARFEPEPGP